MIIVWRVINSGSFARFAKVLPDANWQSTSAYSPNSRDARKSKKAFYRAERRDAKLLQRKAYNTPDPTIKPDPLVEAQYRDYQFRNAQKPPNTKQIWDDAQEDIGKAREKFSQTVNEVKDNVKPDFTEKAKLNPKLLLAGLGVAGAVGVGAYFIRRRKSKNGKQIIERVRRN